MMPHEAAWYWSDWSRNGEPLVRAGRGLELALLDGPLRGRTAFVRDTEMRLWVGRLNGRLIASGCEQRPEDLPRGAILYGCYCFSHSCEAMTWLPIERAG